MFRSIRRKPRYVRAQFAFWGALIPTALIALLWVTTLPYRLQTFTTESGHDDTVRNTASVANVATDETQTESERNTGVDGEQEAEPSGFSFRESSTTGDQSTSSTRAIRVTPARE